MGTHSLICHPETPAKSVESITVEYKCHKGVLWLRYHAELQLDALAVPYPAEATRADGLWQTTCFEAFCRRSGAGGYCEFNFSPSSQWAAYHFDEYREGMADLAVQQSPQIGLDASEGHFALEATIAVPGEAFEVGLAAVIEEVDGTKSYWALAHPPGKPDFHHPTCFALILPAPDAA